MVYVEFKKCASCKEVKHRSLFNVANRLKDGLASSCKQCKSLARKRDKEKIRLQQRKWYDNNVEYVSEYCKEHRQNNQEKLKEADAAKYIKNREQIIDRVCAHQKANPDGYRRAGKKYRAANPDKMRAKAAKRRARLLNATPQWTLDDEWEQFYLAEIYHLASLRTSVLGKVFHVDHMVPLTSEFVCGMHVSYNLQVLLGKENSAKRNHYWPDMWLDSDFSTLHNVDSQTQGEYHARTND